jgi:osmotically-inducible protein OsmY
MKLGRRGRHRSIGPRVAATIFVAAAGWASLSGAPAAPTEADGGVAARDAGADAGGQWSAVARRISTALANDRRLAGDSFQVSATGLLVTLRGQVRSEAERDRAVELTRRNAEPYMMVYDGLQVIRPLPK